MPIWFIFALAAPMTWALVNHIDKYIISSYAQNKKPEALVVFSALISGLASVLIYFFIPLIHISSTQALFAVFAGILFVSAYIPYMYALQQDEVSIVAPLYQMIAPLSYIMGAIFLHESLSGKQIFASLLIVLGSMLLTLNFDKKLVWKGRIFKLMFFSSLMLASNTVIFKLIGLKSSFWTVSFWEYLGAFIFGLITLCIPVYRRDFRDFVWAGGKKIVSINILSEGLNVSARLFFNFAALLSPIALIYVVNSTQPLFIFLYGFLLFIFFPKISKGDFSHKAFLVKLSAIFIMIIGSALLFI
jgi:drug/metabolite transporter (DMT)-like permease